MPSSWCVTEGKERPFWPLLHLETIYGSKQFPVWPVISAGKGKNEKTGRERSVSWKASGSSSALQPVKCYRDHQILCPKPYPESEHVEEQRLGWRRGLDRHFLSGVSCRCTSRFTAHHPTQTELYLGNKDQDFSPLTPSHNFQSLPAWPLFPITSNGCNGPVWVMMALSS